MINWMKNLVNHLYFRSTKNHILVPPVGIEPTSRAPEARVLSIELWGPDKYLNKLFPGLQKLFYFSNIFWLTKIKPLTLQAIYFN